jgi:hypothetical protein
MTLRRLGRVVHDPLDATRRDLKTLPWADGLKAPLSRYRAQQPTAQDLGRVDAYQVGPLEMLETPHVRVRALEGELAHMFATLMATLEATLDADSARKVAYAAGRTHGARRLGTFLAGQGLPGGPRTMAMWQDTAHASAGARHTSALFVHYDDELVEVVRTEDSFGAHTGEESATTMAFFDGFMDGYKVMDPLLSHVEELTRERSDGVVEFIHRFWYLPEASTAKRL